MWGNFVKNASNIAFFGCADMASFVSYTQTSKNTFTTTSRYPNPVNFCHNFCNEFPGRRWRFHGHGFLGRGRGFPGFCVVGFCSPWPWFTGFCPPLPEFPGFCIVEFCPLVLGFPGFFIVEFCPPLPGFPEFCLSLPVFGPPIGAPQEVKK